MKTRSLVFKRRVNGSIMYLIFGILALLLIFVAVFFLRSSKDVIGLAIFAGSAVFFGSCLAFQVTLKIDSKELVVSALGGIFSERIPIRSIHSVSVGPTTGIGAGIGIRLFGNCQGYLSGGESIKIDTGNQSFIVSVKDPSQVVREVNRAIEEGISP